MSDRIERLHSAHLYLVCDAQPDAFLHAALSGGVDIVQLRMKAGGDVEIVATARRFAAVCAEHEALLILNDRPDLAADTGVDGVHVGQDDVSVASAREILGPDHIIGLSTHSPEQIDRAQGVDYIGVGPIHETPTKPGRPAVGLELVRYAADHVPPGLPFFAIGGITPANTPAVRAAGATRIAVVRALTQALDPSRAARELSAAITAERDRVGSA